MGSEAMPCREVEPAAIHALNPSWKEMLPCLRVQFTQRNVPIMQPMLRSALLTGHEMQRLSLIMPRWRYTSARDWTPYSAMRVKVAWVNM